MCEFYSTPTGDIAIVNKSTVAYYKDTDYATTENILKYLKEYYPKAIKALEIEYQKSKLNKRFFEYRIVHRWLRCNCGSYDTLNEDYVDGNIHVEQVHCPLRGECKLEGVVCMAKKKGILTFRQQQITDLLNSGKTAKEVAAELGISTHTVNRTVQNIKKRAGISKISQIRDYDEK